MSNPYISNYTGEEIDRAVSIYNNSKLSRRLSIVVPVDDDQWIQQSGEDYLYFMDITLRGFYNTGDCPIIYFLDNDQNRFDIDYTVLRTVSNISTIRVYSNINIDGYIVEVSNMSAVPTV